MHINSFNNMSFTGQYVASGKVRTNDLLFPTEDVSIVELNPNDKNDFNVFKKIKKDWRWATLSSIMLDDAVHMRKCPEDAEVFKFYVVTTQKDNFENINPDKVLAEAEISHEDYDNKLWIEYLQVRPDCKYGWPDRPFKKVGSAFLDFCKEHFKGKNLVVCPLEESIDFYDNEGFQANSSGVGTMSYQA